MAGKHTTRTWLCPDCDGHGRIETAGSARSSDPQDFDDYECSECSGEGVLTLSYADGEARGLQPWGDYGRMHDGYRQLRGTADEFPLRMLQKARVGMLRHLADRYTYETSLSRTYRERLRDFARKPDGFRKLLEAERVSGVAA